MSATASRRPRLVGPVQQLVLAALIRVGPDAPASELTWHIVRRAGVWVPPNQVRVALRRLEARGCVTSWIRRPARAFRASWIPRPGPPWPRAARRFATITTLGRRALRLAALPCDLLRHGLPGLGHDDRLYQRHHPPRFPPAPGLLAHFARQAAGWRGRREARRGRYGRRRPLTPP